MLLTLHIYQAFQGCSLSISMAEACNQPFQPGQQLLVSLGTLCKC